jgi:hypothetical protein
MRKRRLRDILNITLKTLREGDHFICTPKTYQAIEGRIAIFRKIYPRNTLSISEEQGVKIIRRVA